MKKTTVMIGLVLVMALVGCAQVGPQLKQFNDQVAQGVQIAADVILAHWNLYSQALKDAMGKDLDKDENFAMKRAVLALDQLYLKRNGDIKNLTDEDCVDVAFWYEKVLEKGAPKAIAAITQLIAEVATYFK